MASEPGKDFSKFCPRIFHIVDYMKENLQKRLKNLVKEGENPVCYLLSTIPRVAFVSSLRLFMASLIPHPRRGYGYEYGVAYVYAFGRSPKPNAKPYPTPNDDA